MEEKENKIKEAKKVLFNILYYELPIENCELIREAFTGNKCEETGDCHQCTQELIEAFFRPLEMKPVVYSPERKEREILYTGVYKGYRFYICSLGEYPTAYVKVNDEYSYPDWVRNKIECNGGITFSDTDSVLSKEFEDGWYLGWDYGHAWDYHVETNPSGNKHTTEQIYEDIKQVINQLILLDDEIKLEFYWKDNSDLCPFCGENKYKYSKLIYSFDKGNWKPKYCPNCGKYMVKEK